MVLGIYGAGGTGRSFLNMCLKYQNEEWTEIVFVDDVVGVPEVDGKKVYTFEEVKKNFSVEQIQFLILLGDPSARKTIYENIKENGYSLYTYIDHQAIVGETSKIGEGTIVVRNASIDNNVEVDANSIIYFGANVGHDTYIGKNSIISANTFIAGHCKLADNVYMAPGSMMRDGIEVGEDAVISMGAVVFRNIPERVIACGNPAKTMPRDMNAKLFK